jgi:hypothetical protein
MLLRSSRILLNMNSCKRPMTGEQWRQPYNIDVAAYLQL